MNLNYLQEHHRNSQRDPHQDPQRDPHPGSNLCQEACVKSLARKSPMGKERQTPFKSLHYHRHHHYTVLGSQKLVYFWA